MLTVRAVCPQPGQGVTSEVVWLLALRHGQPIPKWKNLLAFLPPAWGVEWVGSRVGVFRWVACAKQKGAQCFFFLHECRHF